MRAVVDSACISKKSKIDKACMSLQSLLLDWAVYNPVSPCTVLASTGKMTGELVARYPFILLEAHTGVCFSFLLLVTYNSGTLGFCVARHQP